MARLVGAVLLLLLALPAARAQDKPKDKPATPADQYRALLKEHEDAMKAFRDALNNAKTNEEGQKVVNELYPRPDKLVPKFLDLAEKHPQDSAAADALMWVLNNAGFAAPGKEAPRVKAIEMLSRHHVQSDKLGPALPMMGFALDKPTESFLRAVLDKNPHRDIQGQACLALAQYLRNRTTIVRRLKEQPGTVQHLEVSLGQDYLKELKEVDLDQAGKEIETLFERAADKYADVKLSPPFRGTVGAKAKGELFEIRNLAVGQVAPDIEGQDQDGKRFKLADYRGKVILLDFWSQY
jgi:hypothetical protein